MTSLAQKFEHVYCNLDDDEYDELRYDIEKLTDTNIIRFIRSIPSFKDNYDIARFLIFLGPNRDRNFVNSYYLYEKKYFPNINKHNYHEVNSISDAFNYKLMKDTRNHVSEKIQKHNLLVKIICVSIINNLLVKP